VKKLVFLLGPFRFAMQSSAFIVLVWGAWIGLDVVKLGEGRLVLPVLIGAGADAPAIGLLTEIQFAAPSILTGSLPHPVVPIMLAVALFAVFGRLWCGWICPIGFMQDVASLLRSSLGLPHLHPGRNAARTMKAAGILLLVITVFSPMIVLFQGPSPSSHLSLSSHLDFRPNPYGLICPWERAIALAQGRHGTAFLINRSGWVTSAASATGLILLVWLVLGSLAIRRAWCRTCPLGALMSLARADVLAGPSLWKNTTMCSSCGTCERVCPMGVRKVRRKTAPPLLQGSSSIARISPPDLDVTDRNCVMCMKCVEACPEDVALTFRWLGIPLFRSAFARSRRRARIVLAAARLSLRGNGD